MQNSQLSCRSRKRLSEQESSNPAKEITEDTELNDMEMILSKSISGMQEKC